MFAVKLFAVPQCRDTRDRIESFHAVDSRDHLVVVAANKNSGQSARAFGHFIGTGAITDNVPQVHGCISRRSGGQTSFESFQIAVNVADEKYAQYLPDFVSAKTHSRNGL